MTANASTRWLPGVLILAVPVVSLYLAWIGYQGWGLDDFHYLRAAQAWAADAPYIGTTHWELRLGMVLPLAASVALIGSNEPALLLVPGFYYLALLAVTYWFVRVLVGQLHAYISILVVATVPLVVAWGTTPRVAIAECFYLAVAFWGLAYAAIVPERARRAMILSGLAFGLAWLSRESALGFAIALVLLAAVGSPIRRSRYIWFAAGALLVVGSEMLFYQVYTGNPLYRLYIDLNHGTITQAGGDGEAARGVVDRAMGRKLHSPPSDVEQSPGRLAGAGRESDVLIGEPKVPANAVTPDAAQVRGDRPHSSPASSIGSERLGASQDLTAPPDSTGDPSEPSTLDRFLTKLSKHFRLDKIRGQGTVSLFHVNDWLDPYVMFFTEPYYGGLFWLLLLLSPVTFVNAKLGRNQKVLVSLLFITMACVILAALYLLFLRPLPRYFIFVAYAAALIVAFALATLWQNGRHRIVSGLLALLLVSNAIFMEARRGLGLYNERRLLEVTQEQALPVITDKQTRDMAQFLLQTSGKADTTFAGPPIPGVVYFIAPSRDFGDDVYTTIIIGLIGGYWRPVYYHASSSKWLGLLLELSGAQAHLPDYAFARLARPYGTVAGFDTGWVAVESNDLRPLNKDDPAEQR